MCGIAGLINKTGAAVREETLSAMAERIKHRGPDGFGYRINDNVGFAHRRLAIIDVSEAGAQPFYTKDYVLIFNGAIYNYIELRDELVSHGFSFSTDSDTEVLLAAYRFWGKECVNKFNGMWSFAIHDRLKNLVFCSRDRFGVKPFYYWYDEVKFVFASEIKSILSVQPVNKANLQIVLQFLETNFTEYNNETFFEGVLKLPASHNLIYDLSNNTFSIEKYYSLQLQSEIAKMNLEDSIDLFEKEFQRSVHLRLRSDVKMGSALSGGLDSSYVVATASRVLGDQKKGFTAISVGSLHKSDDETELSSIIAKKCNVNHQIVTPNAEEFQARINEVIERLEEPFTGLSVYMQSFLMEETKKNSIKVLLDGQGADEILLGYSRYIGAFIKSHNFLENLHFLGGLRSHYGISLFKGFQIYLYFSNFKVRTTYIKMRGSSLKNNYKKEINYNHIKKLNNSYNDIFEMQKNEIFWAQIPQLLRWEDMNSMAYGIETRLPFLDYRFVETVLSIKNNFKIYDGWSKYLLRKNLEKYLPGSVVWNRRKIGFNAPVEEWWPYSQEITDIINNSSIIKELFKKPFGRMADRDYEWRLYNLAIWEKTYNMSFKKNHADTK